MMHSKRLQTLLSYVQNSQHLMDVGTDHGYLPIAAITQGKTQKVLATDNKPGPLAQARENIAHANLSQSIELVLGEGLTPLKNTVDTVVIAGMGGGTIEPMFDVIDIQHVKRFILQPTNQAANVRQLTLKHPLRIEDEQFIEDQGQRYTIISLVPGQQTLTDKERLYGPILLHKKTALYHQALLDEAAYLKQTIAQIPNPNETHPLVYKQQILEAILDEW